MNNIDLIRNFGIIAHIDAGKTTTTERILYLTGENHSIGEVDEGTTTTDWMEEEKERGITIQSAAVNCKYKQYNFHIIDTPGHVDFTIEVQRSLRVLDGVVVVICGVAGVQTQTETVWKQSDNFKISKIVFVNKLDRIGADFFGTVENLKAKFKITPLIINFPLYENDQLTGIVDLLSMKILKYKKDGFINETIEIKPEIYDEFLLYREEMVDILTRYDDDLLSKVVENNYTPMDLLDSIRKLTIQNIIVPVLGGASFKNIGVPNLLDAIGDFLPSPKERDEIKIYNDKNDNWEDIKSNDKDFIGYIFKLQYQKEKGNIAYVRIYSGSLNNGDTILNPRTGKKEKVLDLLKVFSNNFERIQSCNRGDIVAIVGLKDSVTGDTLCNENKKILMEQIIFPEPVIYIKVEPKNSIDLDKFNHSKLFLLSEDPTIICKEDTETGQTLLGGMGELHLEIFIERLKREFHLDLRTGTPIVAHRERILKNNSYSYHFDKKIGGNIQHATVNIKCELNEKSDNQIIFDISKKQFSKDDIHHIENGIKNALVSGPSGAYPVIG
ncbi:MAG TPA: TetM/TetW/TetO/TetS family tetracycline resistance ribosomal protection protein, partial [Spirochaetota bacterium]|nr:TetM/TetW/TetO/TetS family tetracycline resistance ribosomal protection protein [Spirochaetota bacterium]